MTLRGGFFLEYDGRVDCKGKRVIVPGNVKSILIEGCCMLERFFIARYLGKTLFDGLRDILNNAR